MVIAVARQAKIRRAAQIQRNDMKTPESRLEQGNALLDAYVKLGLNSGRLVNFVV